MKTVMALDATYIVVRTMSDFNVGCGAGCRSNFSLCNTPTLSTSTETLTQLAPEGSGVLLGHPKASTNAGWHLS